MADRGVFVAAFLALVLVVAGAFAIPELFVYHLLTSAIFVVIAVMVFFGEDKFPYMLGMIAPVLWIIFSFLSGGFFRDFAVLFGFLGGKSSGPLDTPLNAFAILAGVAVIVLSLRAWRKEITEKFFGKTFATAMVVAVVWIGVLSVWQLRH